jgi:elongator complex protein 3
MGVTRIELGVQNIRDEIYSIVGRTHSVKDVIEATRILKDAGLKIVYHLMPGLPGSNQKKDLENFKEIFLNPNFRPDMIKIYPCLVIKGTKLYDWYCKGKFIPYGNEEAANLIAEIKKNIPPWVRIMRIQRDIPAQLIIAGVNKSNLRQLVQKKLKDQKIKCKCIRCREAGHKERSDKFRLPSDEIEILTTKYKASEGEELFISAESPRNDVLIGYLRLRLPSKETLRPEIKRDPCSIVRELHIYGPLVPVGRYIKEAWQHKGYGSILLSEAERLSKEDYDLKKILVISALGTKQYYKRFGYEYDGVYMSKKLVKER